MRLNPASLALAAVASICACGSALGQGVAAPSTPASAQATGPVGIVKRSQGDVTIERAGQRQPAAPGAVVMVGDTLRTGLGGSAGITLRDDTLMTLGSDAELVVSNFAFDATSHEGSMLMSLWRGALHMVTGLVARKTPDRVNVQTRTVVLGARGTEFIIETQALASPK